MSDPTTQTPSGDRLLKSIATGPPVIKTKPIADHIREQVAAVEGTAPVPPPIPSRDKPRYAPGDGIRMPGPADVGGFRVWAISGVKMGNLGQEGHYILRPLDRLLGDSKDASGVESLVPCWILDTHPEINLL